MVGSIDPVLVFFFFEYFSDQFKEINGNEEKCHNILGQQRTWNIFQIFSFPLETFFVGPKSLEGDVWVCGIVGLDYFLEVYPT